MSTSILEQEYVEPYRPYSQRELQIKRERLFRTLRVGKVFAHHKRCDHFYLVKENGRKQKEIEEKKSEDVGNCSVCWKFNKSPQRLKSSARSLINAYCNTFYEPLEFLSYENAELESVFYRWLYEEQF